ncbi:MAG TPA: tRNA-dihydrouridine synthase family protein [Candidatus Desulfobacillus sp.]|nr:tRNA-dihydrouridine synthase family protein [Candidatus Desulfobacillus sp.]
MSRLVLAPLAGLADDILRGLLTRAGGYDWCVTEFIRVSGTLLPKRSFTRISPELLAGARTAAGTPVRVQLMGSDPACLAENAARLAELRPAGIDLNFGCPAPLVNRHRGGAALLDEPELLQRIAAAVRAAVPRALPVSAKMRLGIDDPARALDCARALADGGIDELTVHARTRADGYRPPARWEWLARIREAVALPLIANGEVWDVAGWRALRAASGCADVMLGRGAVADPFLAARIRGRRPARAGAGDWAELQPLLAEFWQQVRQKVASRHAPGRLKLWLGYLRRGHAGAEGLWREIRALDDIGAISAALDRSRRAVARAA